MIASSLSHPSKSVRGGTLIETLIAFTIFAVLAVISVTVFFTLVKNQTKQNVAQETYTEAQNVLKLLSTAVKQAQTIVTECTTTTQLALQSNSGTVSVYTTNPQFQLERKSGCPSPANPVVLTGPNVKITALAFRVNAGTTVKPPSVTITLTATSPLYDTGKPQLKAAINLESTVVLRSY